MKKLLLLALFFVGCKESGTEPEPEDCLGVAGGSAITDDYGNCCVPDYDNLFCNSLFGNWKLYEIEQCIDDCSPVTELFDYNSSMLNLDSNYTFTFDFVVKQDSFHYSNGDYLAGKSNGVFSIDNSQIVFDYILLDGSPGIYFSNGEYDFNTNQLILNFELESQSLKYKFTKINETDSYHYNFPLLPGNSWTYEYYQRHDCFIDE